MILIFFRTRNGLRRHKAKFHFNSLEVKEWWLRINIFAKRKKNVGHFAYYLDFLYSSANNELVEKTFQISQNFPVSIADTLTGFFLLWSCLYLFLHLFIVVLFANKTPLGEPDGQVAATICLPCPALSPLYLSSVFTPRYCFPCIYNVHFKILSPLYLSSVYCILFQNVVPLYLSSMYVHSKLHNIHCQLRSIDLIQSFKISSNTRR